MQERRKYPRILVSGTIPVMDVDRNIMIGQLVDVSEDGLMVLCRESAGVKVNRVFRLQLQLPEHLCEGSVQFGAESLWREPGHDASSHWAGFKIIDISDSNTAKLRQLIADHP